MQASRTRKLRRRLLGTPLPERRTSVHGAAITLPRGHALEEIVEQHPRYSYNAIDLAKGVTAKFSDAVLIDVGANIGDTTCFWRTATAAPILAVEGDPLWRPFLRENTQNLGNVTLQESFIAAAHPDSGFTIARDSGTSSLQRVDGAGEAEFVTVDELLTQHGGLGQVRLVKSDTDGFDYEIVTAFIESNIQTLPVYFFEHDPSFSADGLDASEAMRATAVAGGYTTAIWWDNFGNLLAQADLADAKLWSDLTEYVPAPAAAFYWDVAIFTDADRDIADAVYGASRS